MTKLITFCVSMFMLSAAHATDIQDAPIPEPNYLGIFIFLVLFIGGSVWYIWRIMHKDAQNKREKQIGTKKQDGVLG